MPDRARLGDHVRLMSGNPFKSAGYSGSGIRLLRGDNVAQGSIRWDNARYWPSAGADAYQRYRLQAGDVVLAMDRPWIAAGLKYAAVRPADVPSLLVQRVACLRALPTVDQRFLAYLIGSPAFTAHVLGVQTGTTVPHVSGRQIQDFEFARPPLRDQRAIGELLGALDDKIAVNGATARIASGLADARYAQLVAGAAGRSLVGDLIELKYGEALPAASRLAGKYPVFGSGGVVGFHDARLVNGPGVIIGRKGTVGAVYWSERGFFPIDTTFYVSLRSEGLPMEFAFCMLRQLGLDGMNSDSAVPGLSRPDVLALSARVPAGPALRRFHADVRPLFLLREGLSAESAALARLRDTLLPGLVAGELRIRDAARAVEDVAGQSPALACLTRSAEAAGQAGKSKAKPAAVSRPGST
jgi:type I restriction enzyme, S subunit